MPPSARPCSSTRQPGRGHTPRPPGATPGGRRVPYERRMVSKREERRENIGVEAGSGHRAGAVGPSSRAAAERESGVDEHIGAPARRAPSPAPVDGAQHPAGRRYGACGGAEHRTRGTGGPGWPMRRTGEPQHEHERARCGRTTAARAVRRRAGAIADAIRPSAGRRAADATLSLEAHAGEPGVKRYGEDLEKLRTTAQFVVPVVVSRQRILRTRAKFDRPWPTSTRSWSTRTSGLRGWLWRDGASGSATGARRRAATTAGSTSRR